MKDLKKIAKRNIGLKSLYAEISDWKPIRAKKSADQYWGAYIDGDGSAVIEYAKAKNELAALAHELLHLKLQKGGYKRILCSATTYSDKHFIKTLCDALDNELQHHKMFPLYRNIGFLPAQFYQENDTRIKLYIDQILLESDGSIRSLILGYFTLIAPGGSLKSDEISSYKKKFREKCGNSVPFDTFDTVISEWVEAESYDAEDTVRNIFDLVEGPAKTWVGYDDGSGFPESGFFIGETFEVEEILQST